LGGNFGEDRSPRNSDVPGSKRVKAANRQPSPLISGFAGTGDLFGAFRALESLGPQTLYVGRSQTPHTPHLQIFLVGDFLLAGLDNWSSSNIGFLGGLEGAD
jgi:hypothetical protein